MNIRPLSQELQQKAIIELNEVPSRLQDDINHILEWIRQQPHLTARTDEQWILSFLRGCKFSLQRTKQKLDLFYTTRTILPYYFQDRNPFSSVVQTICKLGIFNVLPDEESNTLAPRRLLINCRNGEPESAPLKKCLKVLLMSAEVYLKDDDAGLINGQEAIFDAGGTAKGYYGQWTPSFLKTVSIVLEPAYPARLKGIHIINVPGPIYAVIKAFKAFLPQKLRDRIHVYLENDFDSLYKAIPQYIFPEEYGGKAGPISKLSEELRLKLESYYEWFQEDTQYFSDESKRPGKPIILDDFFNLEGSFRKLEID